MSAIVKVLVAEYAMMACRTEMDSILLEKIDLDRAAKYLILGEKLTDMERKVLEVASIGISNNLGSKDLGISRAKYVKLLNSSCRKIAEVLGWEYSDKKFMKNLVGRELTKEENSRLVDVMRGSLE